MKTIFRSITIFLIPLFLIFTTTYAEAKSSTHHTPDTIESKPVVVAESVEAVTPPKKGISIWWYILGAVVIGGAAAAAAGGGGSSSPSSNSGSSSGGTIPVTW